MRKKCVWSLCFLVGVFFVWLFATHHSARTCPSSDPERILWTSHTNHWCTTRADYKAWKDSAIYPLFCSKDQAARETLRQWYEQVRNLPLPGKLPEHDWRIWLEFKTEIMGRSAFRFVDVENTNCWLVVADFLGELRRFRCPVAEYEAEWNERRKKHRDWFDTFAKDKAGLMNLQSAKGAIQRGEDLLMDALVHEFMEKGLRQLNEPERSSMLSNLIERVGMTSDEIMNVKTVITNAAASSL